MMKKAFLLFVVVSVALVSCNRGTSPDNENSPSGDNSKDIEASETSVLKTYDVKSSDRPQLVDEYDGLVSGERQLSGNLLSAFLPEGKSFVISPLSLQLALDMLYLASDGATAREISLAAGFGDDKGLSAEYARALMESLAWSQEDVKVELANLCVANKGKISLDGSYESVIREKFYSPVAYMDFSSDGEVLSTVNDWSYRQTEGMIPTILDEVNPDALLYLLNSLLCKGGWTVGELSKTEKRPFYLADGSEKETLMLGSDNFIYSRRDGVTIAGLTLGSECRFSFEMIIPDNGDLSAVAENLVQLTDGKVGNAYGKLLFPKFTTEVESNFKEVLAGLGLETAFSPEAELPSFGTGAYVSKIFQKSKISLNEFGAEASAVTAVEVLLTSPGPDVEDPDNKVTVIADHPFVYVIRDTISGLLLFTGAYMGS